MPCFYFIGIGENINILVSNYKKLWCYFFLLFFFISMNACTTTSSPQKVSVSAMPLGQSLPTANSDYVLQLGDALEIKFFYNPELNESVIVRPDGKISLQLIDDIHVAGLPLSALNKLLLEKYSKILRKPEIKVLVKDFGGQKVFVGGEVKSPGMIPTMGNLTVLQAIIQAGGFIETSESRSVVILRDQGTREPIFKTVNLKKLDSQTSADDMFLKPFDIVFVPKSRIAKINQFMSQYFDKLIPVSKVVGFSWVSEVNRVIF